jgi:hypothetical protein
MKWTQDLKNKLKETNGNEREIINFQKKYRPDSSISYLSRYYRMIRAKSNNGTSGSGDEFVDFLSRGRTYHEISEELGLGEKETNEKLDTKVEGYDLFRTRNNFQEELFIYIPEPPKKIEVKPKLWTYRIAEKKPYMWITFPDDLQFSKIIVVPVADVHDGAFGSLEKKFDEYLHWVARTPNVFICLVGDLLEFAHGETLHGVAVHEQKVRPYTQIERMTYKLAPVAHKILWAVPGNHEKRSRKFDIDPLEIICDRLDIPYFKRSVYVDIMWNGYVYDFFCRHGVTGSQTKGGKLNAASKPLSWQDFTMFTIMAHVHDAMVNSIPRVCRDRVNFDLVEKKQYVIICSSFLGYFGTYAEDAEYSPGSVGAIACKLYKQGDYHAST